MALFLWEGCAGMTKEEELTMLFKYLEMLACLSSSGIKTHETAKRVTERIDELLSVN